MLTDPNALAAKALTQMERTFADPDRLKNSESAMNAFCDAMEGLRVLAPRLAELEAEVERLRRNVRGWVEWHRRCDVDDDCTYLNDNAWCDAEALASTGMGLLARAALGASHDA